MRKLARARWPDRKPVTLAARNLNIAARSFRSGSLDRFAFVPPRSARSLSAPPHLPLPETNNKWPEVNRYRRGVIAVAIVPESLHKKGAGSTINHPVLMFIGQDKCTVL
jgi:hypothetical protein